MDKTFESYLIKDETDDKTIQVSMLDDILVTDNLATLLTDEQRLALATDLTTQIDLDDSSREQWLEKSREYIGLALQNTKKKSFPFANAANIKMPILTQAALQFHARAYPLLLPAQKPVNVTITGFDHSDDRKERARRIAAYMNWETINDVPNWEENLDKELLALPIIGCMFRKGYHDEAKGNNASDLLGPHEVIVNYGATSTEDAARVTQIRYLSTNEVLTNIRLGMWDNFDPGEIPSMRDQKDMESFDDINDVSATPDHLHNVNKFYECHCWLDLDNDGFKEPYIVIIHVASNSIPFIGKRFDPMKVNITIDNKISDIEPDHHFTKIDFISNPWGFYGLGLGLLLGSLTRTSSTATNQMLDAGTLGNSMGGIVSSRLGLNKGAFQQAPWEFTEVAGSFEDIKKNIMFWPTKEPSSVLFNLLSLMINSGKEIANTLETQVGENPGQNQPLGTTRLVHEQGMKLFTAIFRRIWRQHSKEYQLRYKLNKQYLTVNKYLGVLGLADLAPDMPDLENLISTDFDDAYMVVVPSANPNADNEATKLMKAQDFLAVAPNRELALKIFLQAGGAEEFAPIEEWMQAPQPSPSFEEQISMDELDHRKKLEWSTHELESFKIQYNAMADQARALKAIAQASSINDKAVTDKLMSMIDALMKNDQLLRERASGVVDLANQAQEGTVDETEPVE